MNVVTYENREREPKDLKIAGSRHPLVPPAPANAIPAFGDPSSAPQRFE